MGVATSAAAEDLIQVYDVAVESDSLRKEAEQLV
jgi:hypothetical protein